MLTYAGIKLDAFTLSSTDVDRRVPTAYVCGRMLTYAYADVC